MFCLDKKVNIIHFINMVNKKENTSPRISRKREEKKAGILDKAHQLIIENGFDGFSLHKLAKEVDLVTAALYRYFPSKSALFAALEMMVILDYENEIYALMARAKEFVAGKECSCLNLFYLYAFAYEYKRISVEKPFHFRLIQMFLLEQRNLIEEEGRIAILAEAANVLNYSRDFFDAAMQNDEIEEINPADQSILFWAEMNGVLQLTKMEELMPELFSVERLFDAAIERFFKGLGAKDGKIREAKGLVSEFIKK